MNLNWTLRRCYFNLRMIPIRHLQAQHLKAAQEKECIKTVFFASNLSMWKYQGLYDELKKHACFELYIVLSPFYNIPIEQQERDLRTLRTFFRGKSIDFMDYDLDNDVPYDVKDRIQPDLLFYPQPYAKMLHPMHNAVQFEDKLLCYYPYAFWTGKDAWSYNNYMQNVAWKLLYSTELHRKDAIRYSYRKDKNVEIVGYPDSDVFLSYKGQGQDVWKKQVSPKKRIIWAPHYSIPTNKKAVMHISNFLWMADLMLEIARKYRDVLQIAFKPHPLLRGRMYIHPDWGKEKTDAYYRLWADGENTQLEEQGFVELFMTSDAMIHDSGSFMVEYHYSKNPVMYVLRDEKDRVNTLNEFGLKAFNAHYKGKNEEDILRFIDQVVLEGNDPKREEREAFYRDYLLPPSGKTVAENTAEILLKALHKYQ